MSQLKTQLKHDMVAALKAGDELTKSTLRMALAAIGVAEVSGSQARELDDDEVAAVLTAQVRARKDSAQAYTDGGRAELAAKEQAEIEVLQRYLPADLTADELQALVDEAVAEASQATGERPTLKQMGQLIKAVGAKAGGRAEGGEIAKLVRQVLTA